MFIVELKHCQVFSFTNVFNFVKRKDMKIMIGFRVTPEFKKFLEEQADEENRTLSNFIENVLLTYLKEHKEIDWKKQSKE